MWIVIDIPEEEYKSAKSISWANMRPEQVDEWDYVIAHGTPLDDLRAELGRCKTWHEMQLSKRDTKGKLMISNIFCDIIAIIDGYTADKAEVRKRYEHRTDKRGSY